MFFLSWFVTELWEYRCKSIISYKLVMEPNLYFWEQIFLLHGILFYIFYIVYFCDDIDQAHE